MVEIIIHNHTIDKSIQQLHNTTTDIKQAIIDIRTSINHMIRSVSEIATKLGFEITLPSPLPLSSVPPTPLPAANENPMTLAPLSPMFCTTPPSRLAAPAPPIPPPVNAASFITPSLSLDATGSAPPTLTPTSPNSSYITISNKAAITGNIALTLPSNLARHFSFAEIESTTNQLYEVLFLGVGKFETNSGAVLFMVLGARPTINPTWSNEQEMADAHNMFVEMKQLICESKVLIFDPGGTPNIESIFDLEDKVDFEGSVMIRLHMQQYANAKPRRTTRLPSRYKGSLEGGIWLSQASDLVQLEQAERVVLKKVISGDKLRLLELF